MYCNYGVLNHINVILFIIFILFNFRKIKNFFFFICSQYKSTRGQSRRNLEAVALQKEPPEKTSAKETEQSINVVKDQSQPRLGLE